MNPKWIHDFCFLCIVSFFHGFEFGFCFLFSEHVFLFSDAVFFVFLKVRYPAFVFERVFWNFTKTSTFSYIVVGFTNIRTLNGTMQHKVLKFSNILKIFLI